ncbi:MAG TPA: hypothetical protein VHG91_10535 [Longimicrobium sp.]|nr:hypothetical protein [Longimicrobium sp.]
MKRLRIVLVAALALSGACSSERPTVQDYYALLPDLVRALEEDGRRNAQGQPSAGPLWVDAASFTGGAWQLTRERVPTDSIVAAMRRPDARPATPKEALITEDTSGVGGRWVREYGVLARVNLVKWEPGEVAVTAANYTTDRRPWPTDICERVLRITYRNTGEGRWERAGTEVRYECDTPRG